MAIEGFDETLNTLTIAKRLHDLGRYELVEMSFSDALHYDFYYENMYDLIENLFAYHDCRYFENRYMELHVLSDPVIVDFYSLAGEYGKQNGVPDARNPYLQEAQQQTRKQLSFSYCLDWNLMGHTEPKRPFHSRLGLFISQEDFVDVGLLAFRLIELYGWFSDQCVALKNLMADNSRKEAIAA
jgi:hypothetical protein